MGAKNDKIAELVSDICEQLNSRNFSEETRVAQFLSQVADAIRFKKSTIKEIKTGMDASITTVSVSSE